MKNSNTLAGWIIFWLLLAILWQTAAFFIANPIILPGPVQTVQQMILQLTDGTFSHIICTTCFRIQFSVIVSFILASLLVLLALKVPFVEPFLSKLLLILRSIPNMSFIILTLFWVSRTEALFLVLVLLVMPIFYSQLLERMQAIQTTYAPVFAIYPQPWFVQLRMIYLPELLSIIQASVLSASSLAFKAGIMAEVLCQAATGIGASMQAARLDINTASVVAWTFWLVLCAFLFESLWKLLFSLLDQHICQ